MGEEYMETLHFVFVNFSADLKLLKKKFVYVWLFVIGQEEVTGIGFTPLPETTKNWAKYPKYIFI